MTLLPASIKVGPMRYRLITDREAMHEERYDSGDGDLKGRVNFHALTITLDTKLPHDALADTLLHEVRHAIHRHTGCDDIEKFVEEDFVNRTNAMYLAVLRENPELVAFLVSEE